jgi:hypothetical protein
MEERKMKNFQDGDYALNKHSDGIVYSFADGSKFTVTLADYLAENPSKTEDDFRKLKELSDGDYLERDRSAYRQTWKNTPLDALADTLFCSVSSPEADVIDEPEKAQRLRNRVALAQKAWDKLTEVQRRRYRMYHVEGFTEEKIAAIEGATHQAISKSLLWAEKKIKKVLSEG